MALFPNNGILILLFTPILHFVFVFFSFQIYDHWLSNIKDWCISRQLWWGHRIPVWYVSGRDCEEDYIVAKDANEALKKAHQQYGKNVEIYQDPDVLDTWFSRCVKSTLGSS